MDRIVTAAEKDKVLRAVCESMTLDHSPRIRWEEFVQHCGMPRERIVTIILLLAADKLVEETNVICRYHDEFILTLLPKGLDFYSSGGYTSEEKKQAHEAENLRLDIVEKKFTVMEHLVKWVPILLSVLLSLILWLCSRAEPAEEAQGTRDFIFTPASRP